MKRHFMQTLRTTTRMASSVVTIYDNVNYMQRNAQLKPGQEVPELNERLGFFEDVRSMRINCASPAAT
jgi:hypothetical protein